MNTQTHNTSFEKILSANDTGVTGGHMGGILIPKTETGLIGILPKLDPKEYNPSAFISVKGPNGVMHKLRYVYYNNKLHKLGSRNEYRITHLTDFLRNSGAVAGDAFRITRDEDGRLEMKVVKKKAAPNASGVIQLRGWSKVC